jgi:hypothetical protein
MRIRPRPLLLCTLAFGALLAAGTARAALKPGHLPLTSGQPESLAPAGETPFVCGTYKANENDHAWRRAIDLRVQAQAKAHQQPVTPGLDYIYNNVWVIENDGTLALSGANFFDTDLQTHRYVPGGGGYTISSIAFSYDAVQGSPIAPGDDGAVLVALPFSFSYGGSSWNSMYVGGNGVVAFGANPNPNGFYDSSDFYSPTPKIAALYLDLNPTAGGAVNVKSEATKYTVTWNAVPEYGTAKQNTVQLVLYSNGTFTITYSFVASTTQNTGLPIIIGIHPGGAPSLQEISFSDDLPYVSAAGAAVYEQYYNYVSPLVNETALLNRFYQQFPDEFFQLVFFTNFNQTMSGFANELNINNDVTGIGLGIFDSSNQYGSNGVLESRCNMSSINAWPSANPAARQLGKGNNFLTIMGQEAGHRWGAFMNFQDAMSMTSNLILGRSDAHWSYYVDVDHSSLEGGNWVSTGGMNYTCPTNIDYFSEIDEYTFGLRTPAEVKDFFFISSPGNNDPAARSVGTPTINATASGAFVPVTVEDIQAVEGPRTPLEPAENKDLRQGFIFLVQTGTVPTQAQLDKVSGFRAAWEDYFEKSCDGRLTCNTSLTENFPVGVVCGHVHDRTTTAIIPEFTGSSLQRGFVQHVPDGGRYTFRYQKSAGGGTSEPVTIVFTSTGYEPETLAINLTYGTTVCHEVYLTPIYTAAGDVPATTELLANHPNPFNPSTTIGYTLATSGRVRLTVFDTAGRRVRSLVDADESRGPHSVVFDGRDDAGSGLASGVYFYRLETGVVTRTRKMVLLK